MMTSKPYGKRVRLLLWEAEHRADMVSSIRIARIAAKRTYHAVTNAAAVKRVLGTKPSIADWAKQKLVEAHARVWCWAIEQHIWKQAKVVLDTKTDWKSWMHTMSDGPATCQRAA